jgi:DNA-binding transcriptional ArsR family regulator
MDYNKLNKRDKGGAKMTTDIFSALSDPTRRNIIEILSNAEHLSATEIYENFEISPQAISKHLRILRESNVVHVEKRAQHRLYRLNEDTLNLVEQWLQSVCHRWTRRLDTLEKVLKSEVKKQAKLENEGDLK